MIFFSYLLPLFNPTCDQFSIPFCIPCLLSFFFILGYTAFSDRSYTKECILYMYIYNYYYLFALINNRQLWPSD